MPDPKWRPEGGEVVASSHLIEIDELTGGVATVDLVSEEHVPSELDSFIFVLSGKIAVTGTLNDEDARTLARLLAASPRSDETVAVSVDLNHVESNGRSGS